MSAVERWANSTRAIRVAILFGSSARTESSRGAPDVWSDIDLHVVTSAPDEVEQMMWRDEFPQFRFKFQVVRDATGGARKVTAFFEHGQIDLVIVPAWQIRGAWILSSMGLVTKFNFARIGLNEISTCLRSGYRFLKGGHTWGRFYSRINSELPGVRVSNDEAARRANVFMADFLWIMQKATRGEILAAQHLLHRSLAETNFVLLREFRLRQRLPLESFGLGRRVESICSDAELRWVKIDARSSSEEIRIASWRALNGLQDLMKVLVPEWDLPPGFSDLSSAFGTAAPQK